MKVTGIIYRIGSLLTVAGSVAALTLVSSCKTTETVETPASMAVRYGTVTNSSNLHIKVSLGNRAVYVMEGNEPRFVAAVAIGKPSNPTPTGTFKIQHKEVKKRSSGYGFYVKDGQTIPSKRSNIPPALAMWVTRFLTGPTLRTIAAFMPEPSGLNHGLMDAFASIRRSPMTFFT